MRYQLIPLDKWIDSHPDRRLKRQRNVRQHPVHQIHPFIKLIAIDVYR